jgi:WhiB family redox-sensing transcriptional regulator
VKVKRDHWREDAACLNVATEVFFPSARGIASEDRWEPAKAICANCTVRKECLKLVINLEEHDDRWGVFGGLSPMERRAVRERRRKIAG